MKNLLVIALMHGLVTTFFGDIQDPPANMTKLNKEEDNNAAFSYGLVRGAGLIEIPHAAVSNLAP